MTTCDCRTSAGGDALTSGARLEQVELELHATREKLARSQKSFHSFVNLVSHDLNAPLRSIVGFAGFLEEEFESALDENGRDYLQRITAAGKKLQQQLLGLKEIARIESRGKPFTSVDLNQVMAQAQLSLARQLKASQGKISSDHLPTVLADPDQMSFLLTAILKNSLEHCDQDQPKIHVSAIETEHNCVLSIRDNGVAIENNLSERIFEAFFKIAPGKSQSSGCGLAICRAIVERHDGQIRVSPDAVDAMEIVLTLPLAAPHQGSESLIPAADLPTGQDGLTESFPSGISSARGEIR